MEEVPNWAQWRTYRCLVHQLHDIAQSVVHFGVSSAFPPLLAHISRPIKLNAMNRLKSFKSKFSRQKPDATAHDDASISVQIANAPPVLLSQPLSIASSGVAGTPAPLPKAQSNVRRTMFNGTQNLLGIANSSADAFGPLKSALGGIIAIIKAYEVSGISDAWAQRLTIATAICRKQSAGGGAHNSIGGLHGCATTGRKSSRRG